MHSQNHNVKFEHIHKKGELTDFDWPISLFSIGVVSIFLLLGSGEEEIGLAHHCIRNRWLFFPWPMHSTVPRGSS